MQNAGHCPLGASSPAIGSSFAALPSMIAKTDSLFGVFVNGVSVSNMVQAKVKADRELEQVGNKVGV